METTILSFKIKNLEIKYSFRGSENFTLAEQGAIQKAHISAVKKAWTPLVTSMLGVGKNIDESIIELWAEEYTLGTRSKKLESLMEKSVKAYLIEKFTEARYAAKAVKEQGLIEASFKEMKERGDLDNYYDLAKKEISPIDLLDPLPIEYEEYQAMVENIEELETSANVKFMQKKGKV